MQGQRVVLWRAKAAQAAHTWQLSVCILQTSAETTARNMQRLMCCCCVTCSRRRRSARPRCCCTRAGSGRRKWSSTWRHRLSTLPSPRAASNSSSSSSSRRRRRTRQPCSRRSSRRPWRGSSRALWRGSILTCWRDSTLTRWCGSSRRSCRCGFCRCVHYTLGTGCCVFTVVGVELHHAPRASNLLHPVQIMQAPALYSNTPRFDLKCMLHPGDAGGKGHAAPAGSARCGDPLPVGPRARTQQGSANEPWPGVCARQ